MVFNAQYGNPPAVYGNIQYGAYSQPIQGYGAWPEEKPKQPGMLYGDWQEPEAVAAAPVINHAAIEAEKSANIALIRQLKADLVEVQDNKHREDLRRQIAAARNAKDEAFRLAARIDEEETLFILLH